LALAVSLSSLLNFVSLHLLLARKRGATLIPLGSVLKTIVLSAGVGVGAYVTANWHPWWLMLIPVWVILYIGAAYVLKMDEAHLFSDMIRSRIRRRRRNKEG